MEEETPQDDQRELQRVVTDLREAQQSVESLQNHIEVLSDLIGEIERTTETIEGIKNIEPRTEILVPLGSGSYVSAEVKNTDKVLSELGADLVAERKPEEVISLLKKQRKDFEGSMEKAREKIEELTEKIESLRPKAQRLLARAQAVREDKLEE